MFIPSLPAPLQLRTLSGYTLSPTLDETFGAVLVGTFFSLMLYGVTLHQAFRYHALYPSDRPVLKFAVYSTVILETAHMALSCHTCYFYLVSNYANRSSLQYPVRTLQILPILTGLVIGISQGFFARRAYVFGKQFRIWVFIAIFLLLGSFGFCVVTTIVEVLLTNRGFPAFVPDTWVIATASAMAVCADFILSTVLIIALRQSRSGVARTDSALDVLVLYTITTGEFLAGLLTSVTMLILFVFVVLRPADLIYTAISLVCTKLYANALLAALNSRQSLRAKTYDDTDQSGREIHTVGGHVLPRTAFDKPAAIELPELPKRPCRPDEITTSDGGGRPWSDVLTESEGLRLYSDSESGSTLWEVESLRGTELESIATAV